MKPVSIPELLELIPEAFLPEKAKTLDAVIQVSVPGVGGGEWIISIANGKCAICPGTAALPRLTLEASAGDILSIIGGKLDPGVAFMTGKLRAKGDMAFAYQLTEIFQITPKIREILNG